MRETRESLLASLRLPSSIAHRPRLMPSYGKWQRELKDVAVVSCTLSFGCILEGRHPARAFAQYIPYIPNTVNTHAVIYGA